MTCLAVDATGDLMLPYRVASGGDVVIAAINARLRTEVGTWPSDARIGLPLMGWLYRGTGKGPTLSEVRSRVEEQMRLAPGVIAVEALDATQTRVSGSRVYHLTGRLRYRLDGEEGTLELRTGAVRGDGIPAFYLVSRMVGSAGVGG